MRRKPTADVLRRREAMRQRVALLLDHNWGGNQVRMANDLGISQSHVSKVVHGIQGAGPSFLSRLAAIPGVRREWLLSGQGQPFVAPLAGTLPVADHVLPGAPNANVSLLSGDRHPIAPALDGSSRYWLRLSPVDQLLAMTALQLRCGDHLLLDTDEKQTRRRDVLHGKICGLRRPRGDGVIYQMSLLRCSADGVLSAEPAPQKQPEASTLSYARKRRRIVPLVDAPEGARRETSPARQAQARPQDEGVTLDDIVAVCLYIARPNPVYLDA